jgi:hypothetical protein
MDKSIQSRSQATFTPVINPLAAFNFSALLIQESVLLGTALQVVTGFKFTK